MTHEKVVLDEDDIRRTLVRIAHEIVEKNSDGEVALVGIHRRGAHLATRLHRLVERPARRRDRPRRDRHRLLPRRPRHPRRGRQPGRARLAPAASGSRTTPSCSSTTSSSPAAPCAPAIEALFDYGRPARVQLAVLADRGHRELPIRPDYVGKNLPTARSERVNVRVEEIDGRDEVDDHDPHGGPGMRHLLSIEDLDRPGIERILDRAKSFTEVSEREVKKVPALRGRRVLNLFYEASTRTRSSLRARRQDARAPRSSTSSPAARASRRASRSRTRSRRSSAYRPDLIVIRTPHVGAAGARRRLGRRRGRQRRRRQARAPDAGAARRLHAARAARLARRR